MQHNLKKFANSVRSHPFTQFLALFWLILLCVSCDWRESDPATDQQRSDSSFDVHVADPAWAPGQGPTVAIDEAHHNFNTVDGRYRAFAALLSLDGYDVRPFTTQFSPANLIEIDILVISNALHSSDVEDGALPNPSAFTALEIQTIDSWVSDGGALWLMADHQPWAGAATELAARFGLQFMNGAAFLRGGVYGRFAFRIEDGGLQQHPIARGRNELESVPFVFGFTGQAFHFAPGAQGQALMVLMGPFDLFMPPSGHSPMSEKTPRVPVSGLLQAATLTWGRGRIAVFGEAGMFSAQLMPGGSEPKGFNHPQAPHNMQFTLNVAHWLSGLIPAD
jgi:hypothetical protein